MVVVCCFFLSLRKLSFKTCALKSVLDALTSFSKVSPESLVTQLGYEIFAINDVRSPFSHLHQPFRSLKLPLTKGRRIIVTS